MHRLQTFGGTARPQLRVERLDSRHMRAGNSGIGHGDDPRGRAGWSGDDENTHCDQQHTRHNKRGDGPRTGP
jgi:hypothetical protein